MTGSSESGLFVHRASRMERLADELARAIETVRPANPLLAQTVVVAHPGMRRWLLGEFSRRRPAHGGHGIAANFDMILPWQWLEHEARRLLGDEALVGGSWRQELLRWHILAALPLVDAPEIARLAEGEDAARRRFQLADRLAGVFAQYLIYRPDWVRTWEQPGAARGHGWQATLWHHVQLAIGRPHRAGRSAVLLRALANDACAERDALHVFGVSHLPPDILEALRATALQRPVHVYFPDPCREHWSELRRQRELLRLPTDPLALHFEIGHPLLVSLGRVAQDFCIALDEIDANEERDPLDETELPGTDESLLTRLQGSLRRLEPDAVGAPLRERDVADAGTTDAERTQRRDARLRAMRNDSSLRVHACHTRLRELEVLKDALLRNLADDASLQHQDIVVMAPDIAVYAPYLPAVFGEPARYSNDPLQLPWHLADVALASTHPLLGAFARLLDLAESRFAVSEVLGYLDVPALARRFAIDAAGREAMERWLRNARVAWGLDATMKEQLGAAAVDANSWQFGLDRLYAGWITGQDASHEMLDGILPVEGVGGSAIDALGQLDRLLGELRQLRAGYAVARPLGEWSAWLIERIDALFLVDPRDDAENAALDALRRVIGDLANQAADVALHAVQPWSVVREALRTAFQAIPERQPFLLGGVTFCGLVPQRSIPFRVVCLLGMNEGEFPRSQGDIGLNRMLDQPRRGDRDARAEDRQLFLEAIMAARQCLHVSCIGTAVRDGKPRNPASPLAELLQFLDEQFGIDEDTAAERPWYLRHPLQPFDARYYERDSAGAPLHDERMFSYAPAWVSSRSGRASLPAFVDTRSATSATAAVAGDVSLAALRRFWRDPPREQLLRGLGIDLQVLDASVWPDREPLDTQVDPLDRFDRRLLFDALEAGQSRLPDRAPSWLARSGQLGAGMIGEQTYAAGVSNASAVLALARQAFGDGAAERVAQAIDLDLGDGLRLVGRVERVFRHGADGWLLFDAKPSGTSAFGDWLAFHLDWAALRLTLGGRISAQFVECDKSGNAVAPDWLPVMLAQDEASLRAGLRHLIQRWIAAAERPLLFFPRTAWAYATARPEQRIGNARLQWQGSDWGRGERDYAPGYQRLLGRELGLFDPGSADHAAFVAAIELVADALDPARTLLSVPEGIRAATGEGDSR